jgi:hypothetical protein
MQLVVNFSEKELSELRTYIVAAKFRHLTQPLNAPERAALRILRAVHPKRKAK